MSIKQQALKQITKIKAEIAALEEKWDKLDSTGRATDQEELVREMDRLQLELSALEDLVKGFPS